MHNPCRFDNDKFDDKHFHYQFMGRHPAEATAFMTAVGFSLVSHVFSTHEMEVSHTESTAKWQQT
jgi:hypothetical protein